MRHVVRELRRFAANQSGTTAIEYAVIAAGIAGVLIAVISGLGSSVQAKFTTTSNALH